MFKMIDVEQGTDEWLMARVGKLTASTFDKIISPKTLKPSKSEQAEDVVNKRVAEVMTGSFDPDDMFQSDYMLRGQAMEREALDFFNFTFGYSFQKCGFMDSGLGYGCSPDGWDYENKIGIELKCPSAHKHLGYSSGERLPNKYLMQVHGSMLVSGAEMWVFGSYHPEFYPLMIEVKRDEKIIEALKLVLTDRCSDVQERFKKERDKNNIKEPVA